MAKKTVANLYKQPLKKITKVVKLIKLNNSKFYSFKEKNLTSEEVDNLFKSIN